MDSSKDNKASSRCPSRIKDRCSSVVRLEDQIYSKDRDRDS